MTNNTRAGGQGQRWSAITAIEAYRDRVFDDPVVVDWLASVRAEVGAAIDVNVICCQERPWPEADIYQKVTIRQADDPKLFMHAITLPNSSDFYCESSPSDRAAKVATWRCQTGGAAAIRQAIWQGYQVVTAYTADEPDLTVVFGLVIMVPKG